MLAARFTLTTCVLLSVSAGAVASDSLTSKDGMTLYTYDKDKDGQSACYDECAVKWPPYLGKEGESLGDEWTLIKRTDGTLQWAYEGKPVYFYIDDKKAGDSTGDGKGGVWHMVESD